MSTSMRPFLRLWVGQLISIIGTAMTQFALAIWIWTETGEVTAVVLTTTFFFLPTVFIGPFAGALVDRLNRRRLMLFCDSISGVSSIFLLVMFITGQLRVEYLYVMAFISGTFQCVQVPAVMASVSTLVPERITLVPWDCSAWPIRSASRIRRRQCPSFSRM